MESELSRVTALFAKQLGPTGLGFEYYSLHVTYEKLQFDSAIVHL